MFHNLHWSILVNYIARGCENNPFVLFFSKYSGTIQNISEWTFP